MSQYKKRKKKKKTAKRTTGVKRAEKHVDKTPAGFQQLEVADAGMIRSFKLPLEEVVENIIALSSDIERMLGIDDRTIMIFAGDTQGKPHAEAGYIWKMDETYCKENELYVRNAEGERRHIKPGDYGFVVWDMRQIDLWTFFVVCHELRHIWQIENGLADKWGSKESELDADAFAVSVSNFLYGCSMMHDGDDEYVASDGSGKFHIQPDAVLERAEMLDEEIRRALKEEAMKKPLNIDSDKYVWKHLVAFD